MKFDSLRNKTYKYNNVKFIIAFSEWKVFNTKPNGM